MTHFAAIVIGSCPDEQLAPYHEFECTGIDNEFVQEVDVSAEMREDYWNQTEVWLKRVEGTDVADSSLSEDFVRIDDERILRPLTPDEMTEVASSPFLKSMGGNISSGYVQVSREFGDKPEYKILPNEIPGYKRVERPISDSMEFVEFCDYWSNYKLKAPDSPPEEVKYGFVESIGPDEFRVIRRTNPNSKWDWWVEGGRFSGRLFRKGEDEAVNRCLRKDLDISAMKDAAERSRMADLVDLADRSNIPMERLPVAVCNYRAAQEAWKEIPYPDRPHSSRAFLAWARNAFSEAVAEDAFTISKALGPFGDLPEIKEGQSLSDYIREAPFISCVALVKDKQWLEVGEVGWWGHIGKDKDPHEWEKLVTSTIEGLSDDETITVVDCHT